MGLRRPKPRLGIYEKPFWDFIQQRELRLQCCAACAHLRYPPSAVCPRCLASEYVWNKTSGRGRLISWTVFHRQYFPELPVPYTVASVQLEEGPMLIANLLEIEPGAARLDMPVHVVFEEAQGADGSWLIYQFVPD